MNTPELLAPVGNSKKLKTALHYGADAVYFGISELSLRAKADNFKEEELKDAIKYVHKKDKKAYITVNIIPHSRDIERIEKHILSIRDSLPDGVVVSDPGVFSIVKSIAQEIPIHISTQANITNSDTARFWESAGAKRLVLARELTIDEIKEIRDKVSIEIECFVHGSICISYSGRCYLSSFLANRSANRGECTNSCRWNYTLMEEKRPGEYFPVYEDDRGTYIMSSRDMCMIEHLDKLRDAGVNSFKIEGRTKGINYVAGAVKTYREAIDSLNESPYKVKDKWISELASFSSRGFTTGMFLGQHPDNGYNHDDTEMYRKTHALVGIINEVNNGNARVLLRNTLNVGDTIKFLANGFEERSYEIKEIKDEEGNHLLNGRNDQIVILSVPQGVRENDLIRSLS